VVIQKVDFINVKQAAVGSSEYAWFEMTFPFLDGAFDIERTHNAVFGGGDRQVDEGSFMMSVGQWIFASKEALLAFSTPGGWFVGVAIEAAIINHFNGRQQRCQGAGSGRLGCAAFSSNENAADTWVNRI
jgi:hypothetical protein